MFLPILIWELRHTFRQRWFHNLRRLYALLVLAFVVWYYVETFTDWRALQSGIFRSLIVDYRVPRAFLLLIQFFGVYLLAPILGVAGMMQARNQRTIELLLTTRQSSIEIVLSFWLAAWLKLLVLFLPGIPLALWLDGLFDRPCWSLAVPFVSVAALALPHMAWSVLVAVMMKRMDSSVGAPVAMGTAFIGSLAMWAAGLVFFHEQDLHLLIGLAPLAWVKLAVFLAVPTVLCLGVASWRLRSTAFPPDQPDSAKSVEWSRPPCGDEPIYWKAYFPRDWLTRQIERVPARVRMGLYILTTCLAPLSPAYAFEIAYSEMALIGFVFPQVALLVFGVSVSVEREMNTWDALRVTALRAEEFVDQKLRAIVPRLYLCWLTLLPAVVVLICTRPDTVAFVPVLWLIGGCSIYPAAVIGLYHSVKSNRVIRSVLSAYSAFIIFAAVSAFIGSLAVGLLICSLSQFLYGEIFDFVFLHQQTAPYGMLLSLVLVCWLTRVFLSLTARYHLNAALAYLAEHEGMPRAVRPPYAGGAYGKPSDSERRHTQ